MNIIEMSTRRRVFVSMCALAAILFGLVSFLSLRVNLLPDLSYPTMTVRTEYTGAAPAEIENLITKPLEEALGVVKNVKSIKSVSRAGQSDVILQFAWGTHMDYAGLDVREKLEVLELPLNVKRPLILRFNPATDPIMRFGLAQKDNSDKFQENVLKDLRRYADEQLKKAIESVTGVAAVKISGGLEDEVQVLIDQSKLARMNLSVEQIVQRLRSENINMSGGRLEDGNQRFLVRTLNEFQSIDEIANLIVSVDQDRPVYIRDVASVRQAYKERQAIIRMNGLESVEIAIYKEGDANTVKVAQRVRQRLEKLDKMHPQTMELINVDDQATFIEAAISEVAINAALGGILAILIIYFFLKDAVSTAIISVSIPISIVATFFLMAQFDISLNIMSIGGIALAIGLLVDNAIVVLENIASHRQKGKGIIDSAIDGASEVSTAVIASTLTTIAVFFPLVFVSGIAGQLFSDQALTVTFALCISLVVALTLMPMLASLKSTSSQRFIDEETVDKPAKTNLGGKIHRARLAVFTAFPSQIARILFFIWRSLGRLIYMILFPFSWTVQKTFLVIQSLYRKILLWVLSHRFVIVILASFAFYLSLQLLSSVGVELIPQLSQGRFNVQIKAEPGTPLVKTDQVIKDIQTQLSQQDGVDFFYSVAGSGNRLDANPTESGENIGNILIALNSDQYTSENLVMSRVRSAGSKLAGIDLKITRPELINFSAPLEIEIAGYDLARLKKTADKLVVNLSQSNRFTDIKSSLDQGHPEIQIEFNQEAASRLGLTTKQISDRIVSTVRGELATRYNWRDRKIDVIVRSSEADRASVADIKNLIINPKSIHPVYLSAVAKITATNGPAEIRRSNQERVVVVSANLQYGDLGSAIEEAEFILSQTTMPIGLIARVAGQSEELDESFQSMTFALLLAVFLVYLVMASLFESLVHPFVILLSIPLALVGVSGALYLTGTSISVVVLIGVIMLAGIVVNNAIVLIDAINQLRDKGVMKLEAIEKACHSRLRPIVMTTLTTVLGLLPLAIGLGEGAELRAPMAITVIGGLLVSSLLTLIVIPVVYSLLDFGKRRSIVVTHTQEAQ